MNNTNRRAALIEELVAVIIDETATDIIEEFAHATGRLLRTGLDTPTAAPLAADQESRVYTDEQDLPMPEEGDEFSGLEHERMIRSGAVPPRDGITEQDGLTEQEWEALR